MKMRGDLDLVVPEARVGTVGVTIGRELKITDQAENCRSMICTYLCVIFLGAGGHVGPRRLHGYQNCSSFALTDEFCSVLYHSLI